MAKTHEQVYDVVWSGERNPGADGKLPAVGNTVDVKNATWDEHHRFPRAYRGLDGSGFRSEPVRFLLRPCDRDSPRRDGPPMKPKAVRHRDARQRAHGHPGTRLHLADLVHAAEPMKSARHGEHGGVRRLTDTALG